MNRDVFVCHASEDKSSVVWPLVKALQLNNISCWVDEAEIQWGDSITEKVNEGLKKSRYVIVVLSKSFIAKNWPKRELYAALNIEATSGEVKVLPLIVGDKDFRDSILNDLPLLNDKLYIVWEGTPESIVAAMINLLAKTKKIYPGVVYQEEKAETEDEILLPKIKKRFTQRDKDLYLNQSFKAIKEYFQRALSRLETKYPDVQTDFTEIHTTKFIAKIYHYGEIKNECKIWIGGMSSSNEIAYVEGRIKIESDNSYNEIISIEDDGNELKLRFSFGIMYQQQNQSFTQSEAADLLWRRFSLPLER